MQGMDLEIFGGLIRLVEGVTPRALEDSLSLSLSPFLGSAQAVTAGVLTPLRLSF